MTPFTLVLFWGAFLFSVRAIDVVTTCKKTGLVALTFDDGINPGTRAVLNALNKLKVPASFFLVGATLENNRSESKELLEWMLRDGHTIGTHSYTHPDMTVIGDWNLEWELTKPAEVIKKLIYKYPVLVRPPYGSYNDALIKAAQKNGMILVNWNVDSNDWIFGWDFQSMFSSLKRGKEKCGNVVTSSNIVLFHDRAYTASALERVVDYYRKEGFKLVTLKECLELSPYKVPVSTVDSKELSRSSGDKRGSRRRSRS